MAENNNNNINLQIQQNQPLPPSSPAQPTPQGLPPDDAVAPTMKTNNAAVVAALLGKCDFPKDKVLMNYTEEVNRRGHKLEDQQWYLGMLSGADVAPYLKKPGDFGIHACDQQGGRVKLMLTARGINGVYHLDLIFDALGRGWNFHPMSTKSRFHKTVIDLVEFHKMTPLPNVPERICLVESMIRPSWFLKHESVTFEKHDLLGKGNFCEVFRGKLNRRLTIAIKVCHANWRYNDGTVSMATNVKEQQAREALIKEGALMAKLRHPNVIKFYGICCDHPPIMIAIELCPGDSLLRHLQSQKAAISIGERVKFLVEAAEGMAFLQKNDMVHRDLAARNCLISKYGKVKIADFGLSKLVSQLAGEQWNNQQVPVRWMAPETLRPAPEYSSKSDVWAFGILNYEVFSFGEKPWPDWENKKIATYIRRGQMMEFPSYTPAPIKALVADMWKLQPADRPDFITILKRVNDVQCMFPAPRPQFCTIARIKGVTVLSAQEIEVLQENSEDIQIEAAVSSMSQPQPSTADLPPSIHGNVVDKHGHVKTKEATVEENLGESNVKPKKPKKKSRNCSRDTHEDPSAQPSTGKAKKKKKNKADKTIAADQTTAEEGTRTVDDEGYSVDCDADDTLEREKDSPRKKEKPPRRPTRASPANLDRDRDRHKNKVPTNRDAGGKKKRNRK